MKRRIVVFFLWVLAAYVLGLCVQVMTRAAEPRRLTLEEAVGPTLAQNYDFGSPAVAHLLAQAELEWTIGRTPGQ
ncbi:MAG: hypothetical protein JO336_12800 [Acidobacteriia bacterium]|nr:hypothetical protein [Terriglobia bacterium]MBV8903109.1 hypothetical protein [Terriglobia bacterium]MBV9747128.1 hypothetical protein [Terriglobia bacterium]